MLAFMSSLCRYFLEVCPPRGSCLEDSLESTKHTLFACKWLLALPAISLLFQVSSSRLDRVLQRCFFSNHVRVLDRRVVFYDQLNSFTLVQSWWKAVCGRTHLSCLDSMSLRPNTVSDSCASWWRFRLTTMTLWKSNCKVTSLVVSFSKVCSSVGVFVLWFDKFQILAVGLVNESVFIRVIFNLNITARWDKTALHLSDWSILERRFGLTLVDLGKFFNAHAQVPASILVDRIRGILVDEMTWVFGLQSLLFHCQDIYSASSLMIMIIHVIGNA